LADAGCGKTELAAQLTSSDGERPAGVLLHGRDLPAGGSLDDLAHRVVIQGTQVSTMEALVAAVDAAGQRARRRLPIVVDALNEAEDPRDWKALIASLHEMLRRYPYVLAVCTLRTAFDKEALPPDVERLQIAGFADDALEAIGRYFRHYRIEPADAELPGFLAHPLTLRLFCEVTNPQREHIVGVEAMPTSLTALFDRYLEQAVERIVDLAPTQRRYYEQDVRSAIDEIGAALWATRLRSLDVTALRRRLHDEERPWNESIIRALEQEGILAHDPADGLSVRNVAVAYDALAGHLIADALLSQHGRVGLEDWLNAPATIAALTGSHPDRHPLGDDAFRALVGLVPRRLHRQQLWQLLKGPARTEALIGAAALESTYLDSESVKELSALAAGTPTGLGDLLYRLWHTRGALRHPLNAAFLDAVLRSMTVADRDLRWTEWIRRNEDDVLADLQGLEKRWRKLPRRLPADRLRATWVMWTLTSTAREVRDQATRALYWFGRGDAEALFSLTLDALAVNDLYVPERLLAASYGVVMARQMPDSTFAGHLKAYLLGLRDVLTGATAVHPTSHWLAREYVRGTATFAKTYYADSVPEGLELAGTIPFRAGPQVDPIPSDDPRADDVDSTLQMDFKNYTLGRLFKDRSNYEVGHHGHQAAVAHVRGTVWVLGWRQGVFGAIDKHIAQTQGRGFRHDRAKIERYGKKYGWIAFFTYAGLLCDNGQLSANERLSDVDIDPSFPEPPSSAPFDLPDWARSTPADDRRWIRRGIVTVPEELLSRPAIGILSGPWIVVGGNLSSVDQTPGRRVSGFLSALLVAAGDAERLVETVRAGEHHGHWDLTAYHADYYTFAGEIPWSPEFAHEGEKGVPADLYRRTAMARDGSQLEVEILAHRYMWEPHHSTLNRANGALVPSQTFSKAFDLRGVAQSFGQMLPDGTMGVVSLGAPRRFDGNLLYLRRDLVVKYAAGRTLIWLVWGEREINSYPSQAPSWLIKVHRDLANVWMCVRKGDELVGA
ncbi:MAG: hypothetical protein Q8P50_03225, partial [Bacillota bacterium]|nr:hypothetical protein [Bacillota bacterium]